MSFRGTSDLTSSARSNLRLIGKSIKSWVSPEFSSKSGDTILRYRVFKIFWSPLSHLSDNWHTTLKINPKRFELKFSCLEDQFCPVDINFFNRTFFFSIHFDAYCENHLIFIYCYVLIRVCMRFKFKESYDLAKILSSLIEARSCPLYPKPREYSYFLRSSFFSSPITSKLCDRSSIPNIFGRKEKLNLAASHEISKHELSEISQEVLSALSCQHSGHVTEIIQNSIKNLLF